MEKRGISEYLLRILQNYLEDRCVSIEAYGGTVRVEMQCGVPQGSILGPLLWDILYDDVFRIQYPEGVEAVGFADDLALVVCRKTVD